MKESDLYLPLKTILEGQGYEVKGEVNDCDVVAVRDAEAPVVVELKLSLNLTILVQAVERLAITDHVYIGVPHDCSFYRKRRKAVVKLLRRLGLGLILINPARETFAVEVVMDPGDYTPRKSKDRKQRLLGEFQKRVGDPNLGGSSIRKGRMTVYRQRALKVADYLSRGHSCHQ